MIFGGDAPLVGRYNCKPLEFGFCYKRTLHTLLANKNLLLPNDCL